MKKFLLITMIAAMHSASGQSTTAVQKSISADVGLSHQRFIDEGLTFNKLLFRGTVPSLQFSYTRQTDNNIFITSLLASSGTPKTKEGKIPAEFAEIQLTIALLHKVSSYPFLGFQSKLYAGARLSSSVCYINSESFLNEDVLVIHGLYPHIVQTINLGETKSIEIGLVLPGIAFIKRHYTDGGANELSGNDAKPLNVLFKHSKFSLAKVAIFKFDFNKKIAAHTDLIVRYRFQYTNYSNDQPIRIYSNQLSAGFKFYFKK